MSPHPHASPPHAHASYGTGPHRHGVTPIDTSYRLVVRTTLWVIAGLVFLGFATWWALT